MSLRLIEVFLPEEKAKQAETLLEKYTFLGIWYVRLSNCQLAVKILLYSKEVEPVIDCLRQHFYDSEGFRLLLLPVEASIPRPELLEPAVSEPEIASNAADADSHLPRINREELYVKVAQGINLSGTQILMVFLSTVIAAIGLLRGSETTVIGAMVIAPLLKPNMALAVATTLGDMALALRTFKVGIVGIFLSVLIAILVGYLFPVNPLLPEIALRTEVNLADVILALASGVAGAVSLTAGQTSAIVGVMVAVALLPPLVTFGMLVGAGEWQTAFGSLLLVLTNLTCLNLAAVVTLLIQDLRPGEWWQAYQARKVTTVAFGVWFFLLSALVGLIIFGWQH
jgi:uncharacterized hydrophobic protein (TIGR00341 family)